MLPGVFFILCCKTPHVATINVFAAASLKEAFTSIASAYEKVHPATKINLNFGGSQLLAAQINGGAQADVFASADQLSLEKIQYDPATRVIFAQNRLALVVRSGLHGIKSPKDLQRAERVVIADRAVPAGNYTEMFFAKGARYFGDSWLTQVRSHIVSKEQDVKAVLAKVKLGEADIGIVYVSDAAIAGKSVVPIDIPEGLNITAEYPAAIPIEALNKDGGKDFIQFLLTKDSQKALRRFGLEVPKTLLGLLASRGSSI